MQSDSSKKQAILYGAANMYKNSIMGSRCVYNWTNMMVHMCLNNIVNNDEEPRHARIFNAWIDYRESEILRTRDQENEKLLPQEYNNIRFLDDENNQTYMIVPENLEIKGPARKNMQYFVVGQPLNWRDEGNKGLLISRDINDDFMVLIKIFEQDPYLTIKNVLPSIDNDSQATYSDKEENNYENAPKTSYDDENMNDSSDDEGNNDEDPPDTPYDG